MSQATEAVTEVEDVIAIIESQDLPRESSLSEENVVIETSSARVPYIGEDARMTQLRRFIDMVREMAAKPFEYSTGFPRDILMFLPAMVMTWIQMIGELRADKGKAQAENAHIQVENDQIQAENDRIHKRIRSLLEENGKLDNRNIRLCREKEKLNSQIEDLSTTISRVGRDLASMTNERDLLKTKLEEIQIHGSRAISDGEGRANKRNREN